MPERLPWQWVTSDQVISKRPCWLHAAYLVPSGADADATLYDGENATEPKIITIDASSVDLTPFEPPKPVYCSRGLFVDIGSNVSGVLVIWEGED